MATERLRPGSGTAKAVSRTDAIDRELGTQSRLVPVARDDFDPDTMSYPIASVGREQRPQLELVDDFVSDFNQEPEAREFPFHQPDDPDVLSRLFGISS